MAKNKIQVRSSIVEMFNRETPLAVSKDNSIYHNGANNLYPNEIERVILNSPSGKSASNIFAKYIYGKGVEADYLANPLKNYKLSKIVKKASVDISRHNGVFFHVGYILENAVLKPVIDVLEYTKCRIGKADDNEYVSKYFYKDYSTKDAGFGKKNAKEYWYYAFNKNKDVVIQQIRNDYFENGGANPDADLAEMLSTYRGQVFYLNLTPEFIYALSPFDACYNDMDSEARISVYVNKQTVDGFMGKTYLITAGLDSKDQETIKNNVEGWLGAENAGGLYQLDFSRSLENIDNVFKLGQIKPEFEDKLYTETKKTIRENIYSQANNVPSQLVLSDNSLFGNSSDAYIQMKIFYSEQTFEERKELEDTLDFLGFPCKILPIEESNQKNTQINENATKN